MNMRLLTTAAVSLACLSAMPVFAQEPTFANSIGMQFVLMQPGEMQVGVFQPNCPTEPNNTQRQGRPYDERNNWTLEDIAECEVLAAADRSDGFLVEMERPYYMGQFEVTQEQWTQVMGSNPSVWQGDRVVGDSAKYPVDSITWEDANLFVTRLNELEDTTAYRLPTTFEWEYACRAGGPGQQHWDDIREQANIMSGRTWQAARNAAIANLNTLNAAFGTTPLIDAERIVQTISVGSMKPNAWGIYDMLGNVWEWTADFYNEEIFPGPVPPETGDAHVLRGAGLAADVKNAICATHGAGPADGWDVGFRVVMDVH